MSVSADYSHLHGTHATSVPAPFDESVLSRIHELLEMPADTAAWWTAVAHRVDDLGDELWEHRAAMEGRDGLLQQVVADSPRLTFVVRSLGVDLQQLSAEMAQLRLLVSACMGSSGGVPRARDAATRTVSHLRTHHRRVHTLLHEAYSVDLGDGD